MNTSKGKCQWSLTSESPRHWESECGRRLETVPLVVDCFCGKLIFVRKKPNDVSTQT